MTTRPLTRARAAANTAPHAADWYQLHLDAATDTATLDLFTEIGFWGTPAADFVQVLDGITAGRILVRVNSPGGDLWDSVAIYNALKRHKAAKAVTVDGVAMSSASLIAMAGDTREIPPTSLLRCWMANERNAICTVLSSAAMLEGPARMTWQER